MNSIRAFVGHSFTADDDAVITAFLRYFDQVAKLHPTFSWVHAQVAEPTELARKVLGMVEGRNVFIGICTKKERVVASDKPPHPQKALLLPRRSKKYLRRCPMMSLTKLGLPKI